MPTTIGKYQIQGEIGRGGFGTVYRAWDPTVHRTVAIKVLTVQGDEELLTRFRNEAAAAGNLHHRNIVTIHDFGEHNGTPFMVMQFLEGHTLQDVMNTKKPMSLVQKMNIMGQVADGLHHAHLHGIVHRDVKPPNIMVLPDETVQIMDFGIARLSASASRQTRTGFVIGTVLYMAPEQFLPNKVVDHRADIWAYGVIYYELLAGRHPFAAPEETGVLYQVAHVDPPPLSSFCPEVPPALEDVVARLLAKEPELRYSNLRELQFDLQPILVDLKREQASQMLNAAHQLAGDNRCEEAQAVAQNILELDPSNREAHQLLVSVKQRLQRRAIQPKIEGLLQRAEQEVQARNWQNATEALESALRLSHTDPAIQERLTQVRTLQDRARKAERLITEAHREMRAQNFSTAFRIASEAADTDPNNASAVHLMSQIRREIDFRAAQGRLQDGLGKVKGFMLLQQTEQAVNLLNQLAADFPEDQTVMDLLAQLRRERMQGEKQEKRRKEVLAIREGLREGKFDDAVCRLEILLASFPGDGEINQLLTFARDEAEVQRRTQVVAKTRAEVDRLLAANGFSAAIFIVEGALADYPGDPALTRLLQSVTSARDEHAEGQQAEAIAQLLQRSAEAERRGDIRGALDLVEQGLATYPGAEALVKVSDRLWHLHAHTDRKAAIARHTASIEQAIGSADFPKAFALIETARREITGERSFEELQSRAAAAKNAADLELARTRIREELDRSRYDIALEMIATALKRFPNEPGILALERQTRQRREEAERRRQAPPVPVPVPVPPPLAPAPVHTATAAAAASAPARSAPVPVEPAGPNAPARLIRPVAQPKSSSNIPLIAGGGIAAVAVLAAGIYFAGIGSKKEPPEPSASQAQVTQSPSTTSPTAPVPEPSSKATANTPAANTPAAQSPSRVQQQPAPVNRKDERPSVTANSRPPEREVRTPVEEPVSPPITQTPVQQPANRVGDSGATKVLPPPPPSETSAGGFPRTGKFAWAGQLPPGGKVVLNTKGLVSGPGEVTSFSSMPGWTEVEITGVRGSRDLLAAPAPSGLTITNTGNAPVGSIEVSWRVK